MDVKEALIKNASNEVQVKEAKAKEKFGREQELADLIFVLSTVNGRRLIWRYLCSCGIYKQSADVSGSWTYFNEGKRSVGNMMLADIMECMPDAYITMMKESKGVLL